MHLSVPVLILGVAVVTYGANNPPNGLYFVGVGYNLLKGNPEGGDLSTGGVDPGLLLTRKIFKLTWITGKLSEDKKCDVPDQVNFAPRASCVSHNSTSSVFGSKSYQDELKLEVEASVGYDAGLWNTAFSLSSKYRQVEKETSQYHNVFYEQKEVCNRGRVRYQWYLARERKYPVSEEFAAVVCRLPAAYDQNKYYKFIENWGTHIVLEAELGEKSTTRYKSSWSEVTDYAMQNIANSVSVSGGYGGVTGSLTVNAETFKESMSNSTRFGSNKRVLKSGGPDLPEPIKVKLIPIYDAFKMSLFDQHKKGNLSRCPFSDSFFSKLKTNTLKLLKIYPSLKGAVAARDPEIRIPLTWPKGTYGLPMPKSGCPRGFGVSWHQGTRFHDTENTWSNNDWSTPYDLAGRAKDDDMEQKFCIKTQFQTTEFSLSWPKGAYCIFKKGNCPKGFAEGWVYWDDQSSGNRRSGTLPDGVYNKDTKIFYCCRSDGFPTNEIILPTNSPFVLLRAGYECQYVKGMKVREEYFKWDTEDWWNKDKAGGSIPNGRVGKKKLVLYYCYYYR